MKLRPISKDDRDLLLALDSDPQVMRFLTGGRPSTADEIDEVLRTSLGSRWLGFLSAPNSTQAPDALEAPDNFVGWFGLGPGPDAGDRQLGYRLRQVMWGQGLATEGARALIEHGFAELDTTRVWAQTMTVNRASQKVMEHCGLRYRRTFHFDWGDPIEGTELGDVEYELTRADWAAGTP